MGNLSELFKYKKQIDIIDPDTGEVVQKPWVRLLGDDDLKEAYRWARIASSERRALLRDINSPEYRDEIAQLDGIPKENIVAVILAAREQEFSNEALINTVREELPSLEDITDRPDAPSLEDQERLDRLTEEADERYNTALQQYVTSKIEEHAAILMDTDSAEVLRLAKSDMANIQALDAFVAELNDQKGYRGTYDDKECRIHSFDSIEEFKSSSSVLKNQIISAYSELDMGTDKVKK